MRFTAFILVFVVCFSAISASSEMRLLEGYVFDHKTQRAIDNVDIKLDDGAEGTTTDERGRFVLRLSEGVHRLSFFRIGYGLVSREVRVSGTRLPILYIEMVAREIVADTIEVVAQSAETRFEELHEATGVLSGDELQKKYSLTLAETMKNEIGVAIRSMGFEVFFHYLQPGIDFVLSGYWNEFDTYIAPRNTGEINYAQLLPIYAADGVAARFLGIEMHLGWRLNTRLNLELNGSYVRGENRDEHLPLPEIPPFKFVGSTTYEHPYLTVGGTAELVAGQERVDIFEDPTDGYAVFSVYAQRDINTDHTRHSIILSLDNLLDTEYRNHLSRIRSVMPEIGRSIKVHYKMFFF